MNQVQTSAALQLVVDALMASATIQALVGNRVQGGWSQSSDLGTIPKPAIVVVPDGGEPIYSGTMAVLNLQVYGLSAVGTVEALDVYDAARDVLNASELCHAVNDHRGQAREVDRPREGRVDAAACWYAAGRFSLAVYRMTP